MEHHCIMRKYRTGKMCSPMPLSPSDNERLLGTKTPFPLTTMSIELQISYTKFREKFKENVTIKVTKVTTSRPQQPLIFISFIMQRMRHKIMRNARRRRHDNNPGTAESVRNRPTTVQQDTDRHHSLDDVIVQQHICSSHHHISQVSTDRRQYSEIHQQRNHLRLLMF